MAVSQPDLGRQAWLEQFCGYAWNGFTETDVLKKLQSGGRSHNWAVITCYELLVDKFFTFALLAFLRYDVWLLTALSVVLHVVFNRNIGFDVTGHLIDFFFTVFTKYDVMNMSKLQLNRNATYRTTSRWIELVKFVNC